jgi:hypothetical protein
MLPAVVAVGDNLAVDRFAIVTEHDLVVWLKWCRILA